MPGLHRCYKQNKQGQWHDESNRENIVHLLACQTISNMIIRLSAAFEHYLVPFGAQIVPLTHPHKAHYAVDMYLTKTELQEKNGMYKGRCAAFFRQKTIRTVCGNIWKIPKIVLKLTIVKKKTSFIFQPLSRLHGWHFLFSCGVEQKQ